MDLKKNIKINLKRKTKKEVQEYLNFLGYETIRDQTILLSEISEIKLIECVTNKEYEDAFNYILKKLNE